MNDVITIVQLPVIEERLKEISLQAQVKCDKALALPCDEDSYKEKKKARAELRTDFEEIEKQRKAVIAAVNEKLKPFLETYAALITSVYSETDKKLKEDIDSVTFKIIEEKRNGIKDYFDELMCAKFPNGKPDFVTFENVGLDITMSISRKKAEAACLSFVEKLYSDIEYITLKDDPELYSEYARTLDLTIAQTNIEKRRRDKAAAEATLQTFAEAKAERDKHEEVVISAALNTPAIVEATDILPEEKLETTFTVRGTIMQLKSLKEYMKKEGIEIL